MKKTIQKLVCAILIAQCVLIPVSSRRAEAKMMEVQKILQPAKTAFLKLEANGWKFYDGQKKQLMASEVLEKSAGHFYVEPHEKNISSDIIIQADADTSLKNDRLSIRLSTHHGWNYLSVSETLLKIDPQLSDRENQFKFDQSLHLFQLKTERRFSYSHNELKGKSVFAGLVDFLFPSAHAGAEVALVPLFLGLAILAALAGVVLGAVFIVFCVPVLIGNLGTGRETTPFLLGALKGLGIVMASGLVYELLRRIDLWSGSRSSGGP